MTVRDVGAAFTAARRARPVRAAVKAAPTVLFLALTGFSPFGWLDRGVAENRAGNESYRAEQYEEAAKRYSKGNAVAPGRAELLYNLGNALDRLGKHAEASAAYKQALEKAPAGLAPDAWYNLGNSLLEAGDGQSAVQAYREALRRDPGHANAKRNLELALDAAEKQPKDKKPSPGKPGDEKQEQQQSEQQKGEQSKPQDGAEKDRSEQQQNQDGQQGGDRPDQEPEPKDEQVARAPDEANDEKHDDQAQGEQPEPEKKPESDEEKPGGEPQDASDEQDLTRDQAEGLLRSFEQMERRQLEDANKKRAQYGSAGGQDW